jgi:hypothetical protein
MQKSVNERVLNRCQVLAEFQSADEIASYLKAQHVTGWPEETHACALARYVGRIHGTKSISVNRFGIYWSGDEDPSHFDFAESSPLVRFVIDFDNYVYPDLIVDEVRKREGI